MHLGGSDRRRIGILQGRNRLKGAQNNILRLKSSSLVSLRKKRRAYADDTIAGHGIYLRRANA